MSPFSGKGGNLLSPTDIALSIGMPIGTFLLGLAGGFWIQRHFTLHRLKVGLKVVELRANPPITRVELRVKHRSGLPLYRSTDSWGKNPRIDFPGLTVLNEQNYPIYSIHPARKCRVSVAIGTSDSARAWINLEFMERRATARIFLCVAGTHTDLAKRSVGFFPGSIPSTVVRSGGSLLPRRRKHYLGD